MIRIVVVDDHQVVRAGLRMLLTRYEDLELVGEAADGQAGLELVSAVVPDVVLMDLSMPVLDGVAATRLIAAQHPDVRVVALTTFADREHVTAAIDAGAVGYLLKDADPEALAGGIRAAARGEAPLDPRAAHVLLDRRRTREQPATMAGAELTPREREVLELVGHGLSNRLIARRLGISEKTVKAHLTSVFGRIGAADRVQAALWWERNRGNERGRHGRMPAAGPVSGPHPRWCARIPLLKGRFRTHQRAGGCPHTGQRGGVCRRTKSSTRSDCAAVSPTYSSGATTSIGAGGSP